MTLSKGNFKVFCDHDGCDEFEDLDTTEFDEAKEAIEDTGYTTYAGGGRFKHYCPLHDPFRHTKNR